MLSIKNKQKKQAERILTYAKAFKTIENKKEILNFLSVNGESKAADIAQHIGLSNSRTRAILSELYDEEKIILEGNGRSRRYKLREM